MRWAFLFAKIVDICRNGAKKVGISRKIFACREKSQMCFRWQIFLLPASSFGFARIPFRPRYLRQKIARFPFKGRGRQKHGGRCAACKASKPKNKASENSSRRTYFGKRKRAAERARTEFVRIKRRRPDERKRPGRFSFERGIAVGRNKYKNTKKRGEVQSDTAAHFKRACASGETPHEKRILERVQGRTERTNGKSERAGIKRKQSGTVFQEQGIRNARGRKGGCVLLKGEGTAGQRGRSERRHRQTHRQRILRHPLLRRKTALHALFERKIPPRARTLPSRMRIRFHFQKGVSEKISPFRAGARKRTAINLSEAFPREFESAAHKNAKKAATAGFFQRVVFFGKERETSKAFRRVRREKSFFKMAKKEPATKIATSNPFPKSLQNAGRYVIIFL